MKCQALIDPETKIALDGEALELALKDPGAPRCRHELESADGFCPSCGARVEKSSQLKHAICTCYCLSKNWIVASWTAPGWRGKAKAVFLFLAVLIVLLSLIAAFSGKTEDAGVEPEKMGADDAQFVNILDPQNDADAGDAEAQVRMGMSCYFKQDKVDAAEWFRKAAEQGNADAQALLAACYLCGEGVKQDKSQAIKWYRKAADNGDEDAKKALRELGVN